MRGGHTGKMNGKSKADPRPKPSKVRTLYADGADESPEHMLEPDSPLRWAQTVGEEEDKGLD